MGLEQSTLTAMTITRPDGGDGIRQHAFMPAVQPTFYSNITIAGGPAAVRAYVEELLPDVFEGKNQPGRVFDRLTDLGCRRATAR